MPSLLLALVWTLAPPASAAVVEGSTGSGWSEAEEPPDERAWGEAPGEGDGAMPTGQAHAEPARPVVAPAPLRLGQEILGRRAVPAIPVQDGPPADPQVPAPEDPTVAPPPQGTAEAPAEEPASDGTDEVLRLAGVLLDARLPTPDRVRAADALVERQDPRVLPFLRAAVLLPDGDVRIPVLRAAASLDHLESTALGVRVATDPRSCPGTIARPRSSCWRPWAARTRRWPCSPSPMTTSWMGGCASSLRRPCDGHTRGWRTGWAARTTRRLPWGWRRGSRPAAWPRGCSCPRWGRSGSSRPARRWAAWAAASSARAPAGCTPRASPSRKGRAWPSPAGWAGGWRRGSWPPGPPSRPTPPR